MKKSVTLFRVAFLLLSAKSIAKYNLLGPTTVSCLHNLTFLAKMLETNSNGASELKNHLNASGSTTEPLSSKLEVIRLMKS